MYPMELPKAISYADFQAQVHETLGLHAQQSLLFKVQTTVQRQDKTFEVKSEATWNGIKRRMTHCDDVIQAHGNLLTFLTQTGRKYSSHQE